MILDFTSDFKSTNNENTIKRKRLLDNNNRLPLNNIENIINNNNNSVNNNNNKDYKEDKSTISWINNQLDKMNIPLLTNELSIQESTLNILQILINERQSFQNNVMNITLTNEQLRNEITIKDSLIERLENNNLNNKSEIQSLSNKLTTILSEHRDEKKQWLDQKLDLTNKSTLISNQLTHLQGTLKKKEKDFEKLQNQFEKIVQKNKSTTSCIVISKPINRNITQNKTSLVDIETTANRNMITSLQNTISNLNEDIIAIKQHSNEYQQTLLYQIAVLKSKNELVLENMNTTCLSTNLITNSISKIDNKPVLLLTNESNDKALVNKLTNQLIEARNIIRDQDKLIHQALFGSMISNINEDCYLVDESNLITNNYITNEDIQWSKDLQPTASPETIALLRRCGWNEIDLPNNHEAKQIGDDIINNEN